MTLVGCNLNYCRCPGPGAPLLWIDTADWVVMDCEGGMGYHNGEYDIRWTWLCVVKVEKERE